MSWSPNVLDFAAAVAGRTDVVRRHTGPPESNNYDDEVRWPKSPPDYAFAVYLNTWYRATRCIAIDLDAKHGSVVDDAELVDRHLRGAGLQFVVARSGPTNGRHFFVPLDREVPAPIAREVGDRLSDDVPTLDLNPMNGIWNSAIRPPLAPHRLGGRSELVGDPLEALDALQHGNPVTRLVHLLVDLGMEKWRADLAVTFRPTDLDLRSKLSSYHYGLLHGRVGLRTSRDKSRSMRIWSLIWALHYAGFSAAQIHHVLLPLQRKRFRDNEDKRDPHDFLHAEITRAYAQMAAAPAFHGRDDVSVWFQQLKETIGSMRWPGVGGTTDLRILLALVGLAERIHSTTVKASIRQLSVESGGLHKDTVTRSLRRLRKGGWFTRTWTGRRGLSSEYLLHAPPPELRDQLVNSYLHGGCEANGLTFAQRFSELTHDAFLHAGGAQKVAAALDPNLPRTVGDLTGIAGVARSSAYTALEKLRRHELALEVEPGRWVWTGRDLDAVAQERGTFGHRLMRVDQYVKEREQYHESRSTWERETEEYLRGERDERP